LVCIIESNMKNRKKAAKQLKHLQSIYGSYSSEKTAYSSVEDNQSSVSTGSLSGGLAIGNSKYAIVKKDLVFLLILIAIIIAILFSLNYLAETTSFGIWMTNLVGKIL